MFGIIDLIGNTPLIKLNHATINRRVALYAKLEMFNPTGSMKDRIVKYIIEGAEKRGEIKPGDTIIDASSGNTGASIALIARQKGYKAVVFTTDKTSKEKVMMMQAYGADVRILSSKVSSTSPDYYVNRAKSFYESVNDGFLLDQYSREDNINAHYMTTGREIVEQLDDVIDVFIACASSGGSISGISKRLKEAHPKCKVILADPIGSVYFDKIKKGSIQDSVYQSTKIEGVGKSYICQCFKNEYIDDAIQFSDDEACNAVKELASQSGVFAGGSAGGVYAVAKKLLNENHISGNIVMLFPDSGMKYFSKNICRVHEQASISYGL